MFSRPDVEQLMNEYTILQMYTDVIPPEYQPTNWSVEDNKRFQSKEFGDIRLPLYAIIEPADSPKGWRKVRGSDHKPAVYPEGKINDVEGFKSFLRDHAKPSE